MIASAHLRRGRRRTALVVALALGLLLLGASGPASARAATASPGIGKDTQGTALFSSTLTTPQAVRTSDGSWHLTYELLLTDATSASLRVDRIEVLDGATGRVVLALSGPTLAGDFTPVGGPIGDEQVADPASTGSMTMTPSTAWVAWLDVSVPTRADVPRVLEHRIVGDALLPPPSSAESPFDYTLSRIRTSTAPPTVLTAPVRAGDWYMSEGCCSGDTHHLRGIAPVNGELQVPQRFGIDMFKVDAEQRTWNGDPSVLSSYVSYRQPVIAAAPGTVVASRNDLPNNPAVPDPGPRPPLDAGVGNFVIEKVASGVYVLYGHLDPGSVAVKAGEQVARGRRLGRIGTSGNSVTPHLHFQLLTEPTFFPSDSQPFAFEKFELVGHVVDRIWDDNLGVQPTGQLPVTPEPQAGARVNELPLDRTVVHFG